MHIEKIKYFIDLFDCCNYTETARKNFISQASLSQYINSLEDAFKIKLFNRGVSPVEPTDAGKEFYNEAKILWIQYQNMQDKMAHVNQNKIKPLRLVYTSLVDLQVILPFIPKFKLINPDVELILSKILMKDIAEYVTKKICDVAISINGNLFEEKDMTSTELYKGKYSALVGKSHPLFNRQNITANELYQYPLIMLSQESIGDLYKVMQDRTIKDGYEPNIVKTVDDIETEIFSVITEDLVGFAPDNYYLPDCNKNINKIPILNSNHTFSIDAVYQKNNDNPVLKQFIESIQS